MKIDIRHHELERGSTHISHKPCYKCVSLPLHEDKDSDVQHSESVPLDKV